ncbi:MAG: thiol reductase thioredoxin [Evtepia sp.]|nr:thiol reductase thioredoxin [Evtepia sp.]
MALIQMDGEEFGSAVSSGQLVMAYFWTDWHDTCEEMTPIMEELAQRYDGQALVVAINADREGFLALELDVYSIPTVIVYQDGREVDRLAGIGPLDLYEQLLDVRLHPEDLNPFELITSMGYTL